MDSILLVVDRRLAISSRDDIHPVNIQSLASAPLDQNVVGIYPRSEMLIHKGQARGEKINLERCRWYTSSALVKKVGDSGG